MTRVISIPFSSEPITDAEWAADEWTIDEGADGEDDEGVDGEDDE